MNLLFLADPAHESTPLAALAAEAGVACQWHAATDAQQLAQALDGPPIDAVLSRSTLWGGDVQALVLHQVSQRVPVVVLAQDLAEMATHAAGWLRAGAMDVFSWQDLWRLPAVLAHIALHGEQRRLAEEKARREALIGIVQQLSLARTMTDVMTVVRRAARQLAHADGATFVLRENGHCHYADEDAIAPLWKGQRFPMERCISGWAMLNRRPAAIEDVFTDPRIPVAAYEPTFVRSLVMVPIRARDPIGAIGTYWARKRQPTPDEVELLQALADTTSVAIENVQLQAGLEKRVRERTDELRIANEELEAFSSSVSHDLRNPLNAIDGFSALLEMDLATQTEAQSRQQLSHVREAVRRMNAIIEDLLGLARVGRGALKREAVDLSFIAKEILSNLQRSAPRRQVEMHITPGLSAQCDEGLVRIALENLLSNAWKYSSKVAQARIEFRSELGSDGQPVFIVRDNGAGFDPAKASSKLFKPFQRLHAASEFAGTGVGLTTVRRAIQRHGGEVWATAAPGKGASFFFTLAGLGAGLPQKAVAEGGAVGKEAA